jgi:hypothetical protein
MEGNDRRQISGAVPAFIWGTRENRESLRQNTVCPARDSNRAPPEYNSEALPTEPACSVRFRTNTNFSFGMKLKIGAGIAQSV